MPPLRSTAGRENARRAGDVFLYPLTAMVALLVLWLRRPEQFTDPHLWARDGSVFYASFLIDGPLRSLFEPSDGFLSVLPRAIVALVGANPARSIPAIIDALSLVGTALSCAFFALPVFRYFLRNDRIRIACCLFVAAVPYAYDEVGNLVSLAWYVAIPTMLLLAVPRRAYNARPFWLTLVAAIVVAVSALSTPALVVFVPLALFKVYRGTSRVRLVSGAFLAALVVQVSVFRIAIRTAPEPLHLRELLANFADVTAYRVVLDNIIGRFAANGVGAGHALVASVIVSLLILLATIAFARTRRQTTIARRLTYVGAAAFASIAVFCVATSLRSADDPGLFSRDPALLIPTALFTYLAARACDDTLRYRTNESFRTLAFATLGTVALFSNFRLEGLANDRWASQAGSIDSWRAARDANGKHSAIDVPIDPPGWTISLPALQASS